MKILYVIGSMEIGGAEQHLLGISTELKRRGFDPSVFVMTPGGPLTSKFDRGGVKVYGVEFHPALVRLIKCARLSSWLRLIYFSFSLWRYLWRTRPDVVHFFLPAAYIVGGIVSIFGPSTRCIMSRRSLNLYQRDRPISSYLETFLHPHMDFVCGNSQAVVNDLLLEGVAQKQLKLIYNGIDLTRFQSIRTRKEVRDSLMIGQETLVITMVANLIPYKGHKDLLEALGSIKDSLTQPWACWLVGRDDGIEFNLRAQADAMGISSNILFLGSCGNVQELLYASDIGVLSSHQEGFSNAILEGMAAGLPMVVTDVGGNAEAVLNGYTGYVVPPHEPSSLGEALLRVSKDPLRAEMGFKGRARVESHFSVDSSLENYINLYRG